MVRMAPSNGITFDELYNRLEMERPTRVDAILSTDKHVTATVVDDEVKLFFMTPDIPEIDGRESRMTPYMHRQIADRTGIDWKYYDRMRAQQPHLLVRNLETWWLAEPDRRLVRALQPATIENGRLSVGELTGRAWLSDRYRTLDNYEFVMSVLKEAGKHDAEILSCHLDDERVYMKLVAHHKTVAIKKGDIIEAGIIVKNSEVGDGRVTVQPYANRLVCMNGLVRPEKYGQVHLGAANDFGILQQDTLEQENKSIWMQVRDWVSAVFSGNFLEKTAAEYRGAQRLKVEEPARKAVANVVRNLGLTGADGQNILERYLRGNNETMFGMVNAVTLYAHEGANSYRRQVELETFAGNLLTNPDRFQHIVAAPLSEEQILKAVNEN